VLTNNSIYTRRYLAAWLRVTGLEMPEDAIWTSPLATADFLVDQRPGGSAYVVGEAGLATALHTAGDTPTDREPDYVVLGETRTYSFQRIARAIRLVASGARFIATNPDATGPTPNGPLPATGSVAALTSRATRVEPSYVGKPNPLMMRSALNALEATRAEAKRHPYRASCIVDSIADLVDTVVGAAASDVLGAAASPVDHNGHWESPGQLRLAPDQRLAWVRLTSQPRRANALARIASFKQP
jgi:ribonucleotide monophosphatase NagD (HAD superfamily)